MVLASASDRGIRAFRPRRSIIPAKTALSQSTGCLWERNHGQGRSADQARQAVPGDVREAATQAGEGAEEGQAGRGDRVVTRRPRSVVVGFPAADRSVVAAYSDLANPDHGPGDGRLIPVASARGMG